MKTKRFLLGCSLIAIILIIFSCDQEEYALEEEPHENTYQQTENDDFLATQDDELFQQELLKEENFKTLETNEQETENRAIQPIYYRVDPNNGVCGATKYLFLVKDYKQSADINVKLRLPDQRIHYARMYRWNDYQYVFLNLYNCGDVYWNYVRASNKISLTNSEKLKNTGVDIRLNGTSRIGWPFKSDGSSWQSKSKWWEAKGSAYHVGKDIYAQDWNFGSGRDDLGKKITSPMAGKVVGAGWRDSCNGNVVEIVQKAGEHRIYFRFSHMQKVNVKLGQLVTRNTVLGTLGDSGSGGNCGSWTPHAHCVMYQVNTSNVFQKSLAFEYSY